MKISTIKVKLTQEDIFQSIQEYVKVDNFNVESITFDENINISCTFKKGVKIAIKVKIKIKEVQDNVLSLSIEDINIAKLHIINGIKNFALKKALASFADQGIEINKDTISVNLNAILSKVQKVRFNLVSVTTSQGAIDAEVSDLEIIKEGAVEAEIVEEVEITQDDSELVVIKVVDKYSSLRLKAQEKVPEKYENVFEYAFMIPDIIVLLGRILKDKRVDKKQKLVISSVVAYFASPIDIGVLFIPFVGKMGNIAMAFYGLSYVIENIEDEIILDNWQGKPEQLDKLKVGIAMVKKAAGGNNIQGLLKLPKPKFKLKKKKK